MEIKRKIYRILIVAVFAVETLSAVGQSTWQPRLQIKLSASASTLAYSPDKKLLAVGHSDGQVTIWNADTGTPIGSFEDHKGSVESIRFTPQGNLLITLGDDKKARIWRVSDLSNQGILEGAAFAFNVSNDGKWLVTQDPDQAIWLWDLTTRKKSVQLSKPGGGGVRAFTFTPVGDYIVCSYGGKPYFIDLKSKENIEIPVAVEGGKKTKVKIDMQGNNQAAISLGEMQDNDAPTYRIISGASSPTIVLSRRWMNGFVDVWNLETRQRITAIYLPKDDSMYKILDTSLSFDDSFVAIVGGKRVSIWDIKSGKQAAIFDGTGLIQFSPSDNELSVVNNNILNIYVLKK